jgi:mono/diheme cytochrome c family protein
MVSGLARAAALAVPAIALSGAVPPAVAGDEADAAARGAYVFHAAGCFACHTDVKNKGAPLAGGRALETPFGTFYTPNITPDRDHGIGAWSDADFLRALRHGIGPDGRDYYPVFPYPAYSGMSERDALDLKDYLFAQPPVAQADRPHDIDFPFGFRFLIGVWKALFFDAAPFVPDSGHDARWNRGAYLVRHLGHCGQCHSPRNFLGAVERARPLAGNPVGPDGKKVPNITPDKKHGIGSWNQSDIEYFLKTGFRPDGDVAGGAMAEVIEQSTRYLTDDDRAAIAAYLLAPPPRSGP